MKPRGISYPLTRWLHPDEPVKSVSEVVLVPWDYHEKRRYRLFTVVRDDSLAVYYEDMGVASKWPYPGFNIIAEWEHTAQEMRDTCDRQRNDLWVEKFLSEKQAESTLIGDFLQEQEEQIEVVKNRSVVGPLHRVQRNEHRWSATRARLGEAV